MQKMLTFGKMTEKLVLEAKAFSERQQALFIKKLSVLEIVKNNHWKAKGRFVLSEAEQSIVDEVAHVTIPEQMKEYSALKENLDKIERIQRIVERMMEKRLSRIKKTKQRYPDAEMILLIMREIKKILAEGPLRKNIFYYLKKEKEFLESRELIKFKETLKREIKLFSEMLKVLDKYNILISGSIKKLDDLPVSSRWAILFLTFVMLATPLFSLGLKSQSEKEKKGSTAQSYHVASVFKNGLSPETLELFSGDSGKIDNSFVIELRELAEIFQQRRPVYELGAQLEQDLEKKLNVDILGRYRLADLKSLSTMAPLILKLTGAGGLRGIGIERILFVEDALLDIEYEYEHDARPKDLTKLLSKSREGLIIGCQGLADREAKMISLETFDDDKLKRETEALSSPLLEKSKERIIHHARLLENNRENSLFHEILHFIDWSLKNKSPDLYDEFMREYSAIDKGFLVMESIPESIAYIGTPLILGALLQELPGGEERDFLIMLKYMGVDGPLIGTWDSVFKRIDVLIKYGFFGELTERVKKNKLTFEQYISSIKHDK
jgi:hypothetical protein